MIISAPLITNWNLSVKVLSSSLALARGDNSIGCSIKKVGSIKEGLATFLYKASTKLPKPSVSMSSSVSKLIFLFLISANKLSLVLNILKLNL